ncbi:hypothetical protein GF373_11945, partial [bacterium]|nr:hypothetical protein [bacterium]
MKILNMRFLCLILTGLFLFSCGEEEKEPPVRDKQDTVAAEKKEYPIGLDSQPASEEDRLAVTWTGSRMYVSQVDTMLYNQMKVARRLDHIKAMEPEQLAEERMRIVNDLVGNYLLILEAYDSQLALSAAEKDQLMNHLKGQYENEADYKKALEKAGQTEESVLHAVSSKYLADLCLRKKKQEFYQDITPEAKQAFYERKIAMFTPPHRSHFNQVYIKAKKGRSLEQAQGLAKTLRAEV